MSTAAGDYFLPAEEMHPGVLVMLFNLWQGMNFFFFSFFLFLLNYLNTENCLAFLLGKAPLRDGDHTPAVSSLLIS